MIMQLNFTFQLIYVCVPIWIDDDDSSEKNDDELDIENQNLGEDRADDEDDESDDNEDEGNKLID